MERGWDSMHREYWEEVQMAFISPRAQRHGGRRWWRFWCIWCEWLFSQSGQDKEENVLNCSGLSRAEDRARPPVGSSVGHLGPLQSHLAIPVKCLLGALLSLAAVPQGHMSKNGSRARRSPALEDYCDSGPRMGEFGQGWVMADRVLDGLSHCEHCSLGASTPCPALALATYRLPFQSLEAMLVTCKITDNLQRFWCHV
jgi:hypothetical protein